MAESGSPEALPPAAIANRIAAVQQTLPAHVRLIAVSKYVSVDQVRAAYAAGIRDFGESRVQEADHKQSQLQELSDIRWHLIGHLQRNKAKRALELFDWIHSVDNYALAQRLNTLAAERPGSPQICLQVKLRPDPQKYGWTLTQLKQDLPQLQTLTHLKIQGLMTILPLGLSPPATLAAFADTQQLAMDIGQWTDGQIQPTELSMGMSGDYPLAVQAGATMIRVGRSLFFS